MLILILGLVVFFGIHSVRIVAPGLRAAQVRANERRWKGLYSLVSLVGFGLIIWGYILYRPEAPQLYAPPEWGRLIALPALFVSLVLLSTPRAPTGRIRATVVHPMVVGMLVWAAGHLLSNGDAAGTLLFGVTLVYAVADLVSALRRDEPRPRFESARGDIIAIGIGAVVTAALLLGLHGLLFGANPLA
ncbi:NnrU family protein [Devosia sp.]|uniref:NnrU family protein n=1 Tax=Devosia sp. TaxID=1871048 RepID=UPI001AD1B042|nr:NnrU family protein [Devosia sp.]MBN9311171.1 NnrU family protein [Devosia sp.]